MRRDGPVLVTGPKLAHHFGVVRQHIDQLVQKGVIEKRPDGLFDQDVSRLKYLTYLRDERRKSPRAAADANLSRARAEWLQLQIAKHKNEHILASEADEVLDQAVGVTLMEMNQIPALLFPHDLPNRRRVEAVILTVRQNIADQCLRRAEEEGKGSQ